MSALFTAALVVRIHLPKLLVAFRHADTKAEIYTCDMTRQDLDLAEALFASGDLVGCIQLLEDKAEHFDKQASNLRKRVRQRIREGAPPPMENIELAQRLAVTLFNDV